VSLVLATSGDFNTIDFVAAAPYCYHHKTGGGAFNDDTSGKNADTVESLEGKDFKCGDIISYLIIVEMKDNSTVTDKKQDLQMKLSFLADPTGQSGVGFGNIAGVSINLPNKPVENGNNFKQTAPGPLVRPQTAGGCLGKYGTDGAAFSNGDERVILIERKLTKPLFTPAATLEATVRITNLEPTERVVVRADVFIYCLPGSRPTGNLQGDILWKVSTIDFSSISGGQQTVPLLGVGGIQGVDCSTTIEPLIGPDWTAQVQTYTTDGGVVYSNMKFSWTWGAYSLDNPCTDTFELHTFETLCSFLHDGEYLYSRSECGCESTKIGANQPQLFFNVSGDYYDQAYTTVTEPYTGLSVRKYVAIDTTQYITALYILADGTVVRADWNDGRVMIFTNFQFTSFTQADFAIPTEPCTCRRRTDIAIVIERSQDVPSDALGAAKQFAANLTTQFQIGTDHTQFAVMTYGDSAQTVLGINAGTTELNVNNAINAISCAGRTGCGTGANGDVVVALNAAVTELQSSTRAFTGKVVIFITNGWTNTADQVLPAVEAARAAGVEVMVVSYQTIMMALDMQVLTTNPDYVLQRFTYANLALQDPIDVSSRICLINQFPCGEACCGYCDAACGTCRPVDSCPTIQGCKEASRLVGNCCVNVTVDTCPDRNATCEVGTCNAVTNQCEYSAICVPPTGAAADGNCYDYICNATNGQCVISPKWENDACVVYDCVNNAIVPTWRATVLANTSCDKYWCDPVLGPQSESVAFTGTPANATSNPCDFDRCDPASGWVVEIDPTCNPDCTLNCGASDQCERNYCAGTNVNNYRCEKNTTVCTVPAGDACFTARCDPATGCKLDPIVCDDNNACTIDTCNNRTGACVFEPVECNSNDLCVPSVCNNQTGNCEAQPLVCDDSVGCTIDTCNSTTGQCQYTPSDVICDLQDPCQSYSCDATAGCVGNNVTCPDDGLYCTVAVCVPFYGCNNQSLTCNATKKANSNDCSTVSCVEREKQCVREKKTCAATVVITAVALTAGVIAGIVVGVVAFIACAGGASYAAFQQMNTASANAVVNNPLYKSQGKQGTNPLFKQT